MSHPRIVHEAHSLRHSARVRIPARASLGGKSYELKDLSASGVSLRGVKEPYARGQPVAIALHFVFEGFSFNLDLVAQVIYAQGEMLGCVFDALTREQISSLNYIIKSYLSGLVVGQDDLLRAAARDNFSLARERRDHASNKRDPRRAVYLSAFLLAAAFCLFFLGGNLYEKLSLVRSYDAAARDGGKIEALLATQDAYRLKPGARASARLAGENSRRAGEVEDLRALPENPALTLVSLRMRDPIPERLSGRPARVEFYLY